MATDLEAEVRKCRVCKKGLPLDRFYTDTGTGGRRRLRTKCKTCTQNQIRDASSLTYQTFLAKVYSSSKHARRKGGFVWEITLQDIVDLWEEQNGRCAVTSLVMTHHRDGTGHKDFNASIDRLNPNIGYTRDNIRLVCYAVNIMRHRMDESEFYFWIKSIYENSCD